jgi:amino acid transporter
VSVPADERLGAPDDRLGLFASVAIVVGGIVGTGIFAVPAAIADYGWLSMPPSRWSLPAHSRSR